MNSIDHDPAISKETLGWLESARAFGKHIMRPIGIELDRYDDPAMVIAKGSSYWNMLKAFREQGFHSKR